MKRPVVAYWPMNAPILCTSSIGGGCPASVLASFLCMIMKRIVRLLHLHVDRRARKSTPARSIGFRRVQRGPYERSEERRVGKECRTGWSQNRYKENNQTDDIYEVK